MRVGRSTPGRAAVARRLFAGVPTTYDRMSRLLSFGRDPHWRRFLVSRLSVEPGATVLDVATGTAAVALEAVRQKGARVVGLDLSEPMLREGLRRIAGSGRATSVRCVLGRAERLPFGEGTFDALTFTYLLRYVDDPAATLAELGRVVKPGGTVASLEFNVPQPPWEPLWWLYTRGVMPVIGRTVSRSWYEVGRFLGPSISEFYANHPLAEQLLMWRSAGIEDAQARAMTLGGAVVIWGTKARATRHVA